MLVTIIIILLSVGGLIFGVLFFRLKRDIHLLRRKLQVIKQHDTNMQLTTNTFDKDICELAIEVNEVIKKKQQFFSETERANREFRQGISNISHDLRTPLTTATGYLQMIRAQTFEKDEENEYLSVVESRLQSLMSIMEKLFEYTRIVEGQLIFNLEKVNIGNLLRDDIAAFYEQFVENQFEVRINIPKQPLFVNCDEYYFRRICQNLINNALNHGCNYFELSVESKEAIGKACITFVNQIADDTQIDIEQMFERFYTSDAARTSQKTGLGLNIVRELAEQMNGAVGAKLMGNQVLFWVEIPLAFPV